MSRAENLAHSLTVKSVIAPLTRANRVVVPPPNSSQKRSVGRPFKRPPVPSTLHQLLALIAVFLYITPVSEFLIDKNLSKRPETFIEPGTSQTLFE